MFHAYETADRAEIESLLTDDFTFTSPYDDHIDRAVYFERCWPSAGTFDRFELQQITVDGDSCFVMYTGHRRRGNRFHNAERFELAGDRIRAVEVFFGLPPSSRPERPPVEELRDLLDRRAGAILARDARAMIALYAADAIGFSLAPPLRIDTASLRDPAQLEAWFATWSGPIRVELHDLDVRTGGDIGFATAMQRLIATSTTGTRTDLWSRASFGFCKEDGAWKIANVHESVPFAMDGSYRALVDLAP
jgi:ketosteroid isomerase-like protein